MKYLLIILAVAVSYAQPQVPVYIGQQTFSLGASTQRLGLLTNATVQTVNTQGRSLYVDCSGCTLTVKRNMTVTGGTALTPAGWSIAATTAVTRLIHTFSTASGGTTLVTYTIAAPSLISLSELGLGTSSTANIIFELSGSSGTATAILTWYEYK